MRNNHYFGGILCVFVLLNLSVFGQNVPKPLNSEFLISEGIKCHDKQLYDSARFYFEQITRNDSLYGTACYEIALGYYEEKEYDSALVYIRKSVNSKEIGIAGQARILMGTIFDDAEMPDSALMCYKTALQRMPYNSKLHYDLGLTYFKMDSLDLSEQHLIQAIKVNPTYYRATFALGRLNEKMNRRIEAMLCYYMAGLINPNAELVRLTELYLAGESDIIPLRNEYIPTSQAFEKIEEYINSKIAMTAKYKPVFKSQSAFVRQGDLLFKYLEYDPKADNFYMDYYVRFFTSLRNKDKKFIETSMYIYFSGFNIENVQKWIKSNSSKIQKFYGVVRDEIGRIAAKGFINDARYQGMNYAYTDGILSAFGKIGDEKSKLREGLWHFVRKDGLIHSTENYKNGKIDGEEKNFNTAGQLIENFSYVNGKKVGEGKVYHADGKLKAEGTFENDKLNGKLTYYFSTGQKQSEENYKNDILNGLFINYFKNGEISDSVSWSNGKQNGTYCVVYPNGQLSVKGQLINDLVEGELTYYYPDGQISRQGNFIKNNPTGKWTDYHPNGVISSIYFYNDKGNFTDTAKYFDANGVPTSAYVYSNNGKNIQKTFYRMDGSIFAKEEVKNENVIKIESFDKEGKSLETTNISNAGTYVKYRNRLGNISAEGMIKNGKEEGRWAHYGLFGEIERISYYKNGELNGTDTSFFPNGKIEIIMNYKDNKADGYGCSYNLAGKITIEGYCVDDAKEGYWLFYDNFGNITQRAYYTNDELDQWQQYYYPNGNLNQEIYYNNFIIREIINYDTLGIAYETVTIPDSACKIFQHYPNGKIARESHYIGGVLNGEQTVFFPNGQKNHSSNEIMGKTYGAIEYYNEDGKLISKAVYIDDKLYGNSTVIYGSEKRIESKNFNGQTYDTLKYYSHENKPIAFVPYMEDERHGLASYYSESDEAAYQLLYYDGVAIECISPKNNERIKVENDKKITTYYANGTKSAEISFLNGYFDGEQLEYYTNGKLYLKYNSEAGENNGNYVEYYSNGNLKEEGNFIYGEFDGVVKKYYPNGKLKSEEFYVFGKQHGEQKHYNQQGNLTKKTMYYYGEVQE